MDQSGGLASAAELSVTLNGRVFRGVSWGDPGGDPVLLVHGWLDNAASFYCLAPGLQQQVSRSLYIVALDLAGHGQSDHRQPGHPYNIWMDVGEIFAFADHMQWPSFSLLGHSRGGIVALLAAGTFPERINRLGLIDGFWPALVSEQDAPAVLAQSISEVQNPQHHRMRTYPDQQTMVKVLTRNRWRISPETAQVIVARGSTPVDGGFIWSFDPLLRCGSAVKLTEGHLAAFTARVLADTLVLVGSKGSVIARQGLDCGFSALRRARRVSIDGGHYIHSEDTADKVIEQLTVLLSSDGL